MKRILLAIAVALAACHPTLPPEPPYTITPTPAPPYNTSDRDGIGTELGDVCAQLRKVNCPEGFLTKSKRTCFEHLTTLTAIAPVPIACVKGATSQDAVRLCGDDNTTRFRCK